MRMIRRRSRLISSLVWLVFAFATGAALLVALAGYGYSFGWWNLTTGFGLLPYGVYIGGPAALLALIVGAVSVATRRWGLAIVSLAALVFGLGAAGLPFNMQRNATNAPHIHDITTDMTDPPVFVALKKLRDDTPNGSAYGGSIVADQQRAGYPDIAPVMLKLAPAEAMSKAEQVARDMGWQIAASDANQIEATATTPWFGFKDDIVVRVRPAANGSLVDIRSVSRIGSSDLGTNAKRVRDFIARLKAQP